MKAPRPFYRLFLAPIPFAPLKRILNVGKCFQVEPEVIRSHLLFELNTEFLAKSIKDFIG